MWLALAFLSAALLGCYDAFKKEALDGNAVIPVLFLNTLFCSLIFLPFILLSSRTSLLDGGMFKVATDIGWETHRWILLKSVIVLSSWLFGYFGIKHLPLTIVGPINATRPVMVLVGAMLLFGERLNGLQWIGVGLAVVSFFLLSRSGRKEGIDFEHNVWICFVVVAAVLGAVSGLYDKFLMAPPLPASPASVSALSGNGSDFWQTLSSGGGLGKDAFHRVNLWQTVSAGGGLGLDRMAVQSWYNVYQCGMMAVMLAVLWWPNRRKTTPFRWRWSILFISLFLSAADFVYFYALSLPDALISVVSMVRRGSVLVSFLFGAWLFHERNLRSKALDLALVLLGMLFLFLGSR